MRLPLTVILNRAFLSLASSAVVVSLVAGERVLAGSGTAQGSGNAPIVRPITPPSTAGARLQSNNLVHLGTFQVPTELPDCGPSGSQGFTYGGTALGINPSKPSLYLVGHDYGQCVGEISIPELGSRATLLHALVDPTGGKLSQINPGQQNKIGGFLALSDRLIVSAFTFYDGSATAVADHFRRSLDLNDGTVTSPYRVGGMGPGFYGGYMATVPSAWQSALGGAYVTGQCCLSIISRSSFGPALFTFNPTSTGQTAIPLVYYTQSNPLEPYGATGSHTLFTGATRIRGVVFPNGSSSVLFIGTQGLGNYCYGDASPCGDPTNGDKGEHAYPYAAYVWAYDANDLAAVRSGAKQPWSIRPYAVWSLSDITIGFDGIGGATYDPGTNRIYIAEKRGDGTEPVIHVYAIR